MEFFKRIAVVLVLVLGPVQAGVAQDGTIETGSGSALEMVTQDAVMENRIREIIQELDGYADVTVSVRSGIVTLDGTALDSAKIEELTALTGRVEGVVAIENEVSLSTNVSERLTPAMERFMSRGAQLVAFLPLFGVALLAFAFVAWIGFFIARRRQPWERLAPNAFIADLYRTVFKLASLIAGLVVALDILGATALLSTILGAAGIVGLAIGFAVRDTVENFIASVLLSVRQPFRPNDAIEINGDEGKVIRLTSRATILLSWDGNHIRIPNATVFKSRILNYSRNPERRFTFDMGVAYGTDLAAAKALAEETVAGLPFVLEAPAPGCWTTTLNGSDVGMTVAGRVDQRETDLRAARSEAIRQVLVAFEAAAIEMPEPTYRLISQDETREEPPVTQDEIAAIKAVQDVQAAPEQELEAMVNEERETGAAEDLLKPNTLDE